MKVDMSAKAVTRRWRKVGELVRVCKALAGPRWKKPQIFQTPQEGASGGKKGSDAHDQS